MAPTFQHHQAGFELAGRLAKFGIEISIEFSRFTRENRPVRKIRA
jgi:hypothetical protein